MYFLFGILVTLFIAYTVIVDFMDDFIQDDLREDNEDKLIRLAVKLEREHSYNREMEYIAQSFESKVPPEMRHDAESFAEERRNVIRGVFSQHNANFKKNGTKPPEGSA